MAFQTFIRQQKKPTIFYYSLDVTYFKSSLDTKLFDVFWNTYWVNTLCANPLQNNADYVTSQLADLGAKMEHIGFKNSLPFRERLRKAERDSGKLGCEVLQGLMLKAVKNGLFGLRPSSSLAL
uniref:Cop9 signalosome subunit 5 C-terminal domain-containing protein n=1 Tax=Globodera pallida TaxID=36090 RepID=A0A183CGU7_GLOPA